MRKKEKTITLFVIFIFTLLFSNGSVLAEEEGRKLEIVYPQIPGVSTPEVVSIGLPGYVEYIFHLSFYLVAFAILGALIYGGIQYFTSFGNPGKLTAAKQGIVAGLSGVIILLSSYLIFNTINPQLTIMEAPDPDIIEPVIKPGIYLCNYHPEEDVDSLIITYKVGTKDEKIQAAIKLNEIMNKAGTKKACLRVCASTNLSNFSFKPAKNTSFVIPEKEYVYNKEHKEVEVSWKYNYGIIFHEKDNRRGESEIGFLYEEKTKIALERLTSANSVTLFLKNDISSGAVTLYQCLNYNEGNEGEASNLCPEGVTGEPVYKSFPISGNKPIKISQNELGKLARTGDKKDGTRSIDITPDGSCFALLFSDDNQQGKICNAFSKDTNNLLQYDIGKCGIMCFFISDTEERLEDCVPCLKSMMIIKGQLID